MAANGPGSGWVLQLQGDSLFLRHLASSHCRGAVRVLERENQFYLEADAIDAARDPAAAEREGNDLLLTLFGLARIGQSNFRKAHVNAVIRRAADGTWGQPSVQAPPFRIEGRSSVGFSTGEKTALWEQRLALANRDTRVKCALKDFAGEPDLPRLRRVYETIWTGFNPKSLTVAQKLLSEALAVNEKELVRFSTTVNRGKGEAAHSTFRYPSDPNAMTLQEAFEYLAGPLDRWMQWKSEGPNRHTNT